MLEEETWRWKPTVSKYRKNIHINYTSHFWVLLPASMSLPFLRMVIVVKYIKTYTVPHYIPILILLYPHKWLLEPLTQKMISSYIYIYSTSSVGPTSVATKLASVFPNHESNWVCLKISHPEIHWFLIISLLYPYWTGYFISTQPIFKRQNIIAFPIPNIFIYPHDLPISGCQNWQNPPFFLPKQNTRRTQMLQLLQGLLHAITMPSRSQALRGCQPGPTSYGYHRGYTVGKTINQPWLGMVYT